jgi:hypothetical protein
VAAAADLAKRTAYLRQQRDKLVQIKQEARQRAFNEQQKGMSAVSGHQMHELSMSHSFRNDRKPLKPLAMRCAVRAGAVQQRPATMCLKLVVRWRRN